jgi:hypothetical protein
VIKLDCPTKFVRLQIESPPPIAPKDTKVISVNKGYGSGELATMKKVQYFTDEKDYNDKTKLHMYRVNEAVAKEMKECWDNMGNGKLNLFSSWFQYIGTQASDAKSKGGLVQYIPEVLEAPTVCVICARIELDKDLYSDISESIIDTPSTSDYKDKPQSLIFWLTHTPIPRTSVSYYEYLTDDVNKAEYGPEERNFKYTEKPFAIVFARTNTHIIDKLGKLIDKIAGTSSENSATSALYVVPYDDASLKDYCSVLAN